ncbi:MAG: NAD(P)/FAD-dependent oxidoreductase [Spirochaetia bacterium]|nr:NAD(P)/FAD-dependent oxidoreductase [Spirochaetia bacterium]
MAWQKMPEPFEKFVYPGRTFELYGDEARFKSDLLSQFPAEAEAIERYFQDIRKASALFGKSMMIKSTAPSLESFRAQMVDKNIVTLKDYLDFHFKNTDLKAILASQWGDYGLPPSKCTFATHAALVVHYFNGGFYPIGGAGKIFESVEPIIEAAGGMVLPCMEVQEILVEDGKAVGVRTKALRGGMEEQTFYAPVILSGAGAYPTYSKLLPSSAPVPFRNALADFYKREKMATSLCIYLGLSKSPATLGFKGENYWIFGSTDHEENFARRNEWLTTFGEVSGYYMSFPSLKDPLAKNHTADIIAFCDYSVFEKWKELPWKKRGEGYEEMKKKIAAAVIESLERRFPGFKDMVEFIEVSTPLTNEHFTAHPDGAIYGLACVPERYDKTKSPWFDVSTPIPGLYLTGADAGGSPGIAGAMMGGLAAALKVLGSRDLLKQILTA